MHHESNNPPSEEQLDFNQRKLKQFHLGVAGLHLLRIAANTLVMTALLLPKHERPSLYASAMEYLGALCVEIETDQTPPA